MAQKIGELIAVDGDELEVGDTIIVHPTHHAMVDEKPTREGNPGAWHIPIRFFEPGRMSIPVLTGRDLLTTYKPVVKVVYDEALVKAAGLDLGD